MIITYNQNTQNQNSDTITEKHQNSEDVNWNAGKGLGEETDYIMDWMSILWQLGILSDRYQFYSKFR
jgi:hypothetical protein